MIFLKIIFPHKMAQLIVWQVLKKLNMYLNNLEIVLFWIYPKEIKIYTPIETCT